MIIDLPCKDFERPYADGLAYELRRKTGTPIICSRLITSHGVAVYRVQSEYELYDYCNPNEGQGDGRVRKQRVRDKG